MIGLFIILLVMGGSLLGATVLLVGAMFWTGRLGNPNSESARLQSSKTQAKIAEFEAETADARFRKAQAIAAQQVMEAKTTDELQRLHDEGFQRQLESGRTE